MDLSIIGKLERAVAQAGPVNIEAAGFNTPTYPITAEVFTTLQKTVVPAPPPPPYPNSILYPCQLSQYAANGYGVWGYDRDGYPSGPPCPFVRPPMVVGDRNGPPPPDPSVRDPLAATLLTFFAMSDVHLCDKEGPAQFIYSSYQYPNPITPQGPPGNCAEYSGIILSTTQVLDAAIQTINVLHQVTPFDFGISLGDMANNTQYNELRWFIDVMDGLAIQPSSGDHRGADSIGYQKPYQPAGLDRSIPWYAAVGNHDQFWMGGYFVTDYIKQTLVGPNILNIGPITTNPPDLPVILNDRGIYTGVVDGTTEFGDIINVGIARNYPTPPQVFPDPHRRSLSLSEWMGEFFNTASTPVGHGFTPESAQDGFACYHFYPRAKMPIKFIVINDTDVVNADPYGYLDQRTYDWLINELDEGEAAGELMVICAHVPLMPYAYWCPQDPPPPISENPYYPLWQNWTESSYITPQDLTLKLHQYKNLIMWLAGHTHRNCVTPKPSPDGNPENSFWVVETPSLRDFPQQFRHLEIVRNRDNSISIFTHNVDTAINPVPAGNGSVSPAWNSRHYAIGTTEIFQYPINLAPNASPLSGVYNVELVKHLSAAMQAKLAQIGPKVNYFKINGGTIVPGPQVFLNNTVAGSTPTHYMAAEDPGFSTAKWLPYSTTPSFTPSSRFKTIYFKVKDGSGQESPVVNSRLSNPIPAVLQLLVN